MMPALARWILWPWQYAWWRFCVVGAVNTLFGYSVYALLVLAAVPPPAALLLATVAGVLFNFQTIGRAVFFDRDPRRFVRFVGVYGVVYLVNLLLLELAARLGSGPLVAQALALPPVVVLSFLLLRTLVFRPLPAKDNPHGAQAD